MDAYHCIALLKCASFELIEFLLSSEAHEESIHIADENGLKLLHYACLYNYCMEKHFETLRDERDKTSGKGYVKVIDRKGPDVLKEVDNEGRYFASGCFFFEDDLRFELLLQYYPDAIDGGQNWVNCLCII